MMLNPRHAFALVSLLLCSVSPAQSDSKSAFKDYQTYLNYHRARIDAEFHPKTDVSASGKTHAAKLAPAVEKLDIDAVRAGLAGRNSERPQVIRILKGSHQTLPPQILKAEIELASLVKLRDDPETSEEDKPKQETIAQLEKNLRWLQEREDFYHKELIAMTGEPSEADLSLDLYNSLIDLEVAKVDLAAATSPTEKRLAQSKVELLSQRSEGKTMHSVRKNLPRAQMGHAASTVSKKLKSITVELRALGSRDPEKRRQLTKLQQLYQSELTSMRERHSDERSQRNRLRPR